MSYAVVISEQAEADLRGIFEYIAFELLSIQDKRKERFFHLVGRVKEPSFCLI